MAGVDGKAKIRKVGGLRASFSETAYTHIIIQLGPTGISTSKRRYP